MLTSLNALKRILVGRPFRTERAKAQPLPQRLALPVFSANALSSVAYSPDEILLTLALAGVAAVALSPLVGLAVMVVLLVIVASYRQSVHAYPSGGDYQIASENLGKNAGITVGSALMFDYVLTVAVSMSSAAHYVIAAFPALRGWQTTAAVAGVVILALLHLRGLRRGGRSVAIPTYAFVGLILLSGCMRRPPNYAAMAPDDLYQRATAAYESRDFGDATHRARLERGPDRLPRGCRHDRAVRAALAARDRLAAVAHEQHRHDALGGHDRGVVLRAVALRDELHEATGLEARGHQNARRARVDAP
mgnify:CR=1 FL=1